MSLTALLIFSAALIADSISPGPTVAAMVARVLARGTRDVLPFLLAIWLGEAIWLCAALAGLAVLISSVEWIFVIVKWIAVVYLLYLAWRYLHMDERVEESEMTIKGSGVASFLSGLSISIGNPKNMLFYLAIVPALIDMRDVTPVIWFQLIATLIVTLVIVDLTWVALAAKSRGYLRNSRMIKRINQISASLMATAAVAIAVRQ